MAENNKNSNKTAPVNPRRTAYNVLLKVDSEGGYSNISLNAALGAAGLESRDKAFVTKIVYGVLENSSYLDYIIDRLSKVKSSKLEPEVRCILRMGLYQMTFLDTPDSAAVNESVNLAKKLKLFRATGFINGLLRSYIRGGKSVELPDRRKNPALYLCVRYSCPRWLVELWQEAYGGEVCEKILQSLSERPPIYARVNTAKISAEALAESFEQRGVSAEKSSLLPDCLILENTGSVKELPQYVRGEFHVQDGSSQLCCMIAAPGKGSKVYDVCAAPGGKTFTLAELMGDSGEVVSCDIYPHRVELIAEGAKRLGLKCVNPSVKDALTEITEQDGDLVLCDVPCSGLGIIRRKPEIKHKSPQEVGELPDLQYRILENSAKLVREGGRLVYSTCTLNSKENSEVVQRFLREHREFAPCPIKLPDGVRRVIDEPDSMLTIFPFMADTDGFFISTMTRGLN